MSQNYITVFDKYKIRQEDYFNSYKDSDKKYYLEPQNNEELKEKINQQEEILKQYKYYEDIPRLDIMYTSFDPVERFLSNFYILSMLGLYCGHKFSELLYGMLIFTRTIQLQKKINILGTNSICRDQSLQWLYQYIKATRIWLSITNQPQNKGIYAPFRLEKKVQNQFDLQYDLYKNNEKIKYEDQYIDPKEADKILRQKENQFENERRKIWRELNL